MGSVSGGPQRPESAVLIKKAAQRKGNQPFSVVAGVAVSKSAVVRNRVKRRLRAILRERTERLPCSVVAIARRPAATLSFKELEAACDAALRMK